MLRGFRKYLVLFCGVLALAGCKPWSNAKCGDSVYVKMGEQVLKVPREMIGLSLNNQHISKSCPSSVTNPIVVDKLSVSSNTFTLPGYDYNLSIQLKFKILPAPHRDINKEINDKLAAENKTIKDLPLENGYRVFEKIYLIPEDKKMVGLNGEPLIFMGGLRPLGMSTGFLWKENIYIYVHVNSTGKPGVMLSDLTHIPMSVWNELYPLILDRLESFKVTDTNHSIQGQK